MCCCGGFGSGSNGPLVPTWSRCIPFDYTMFTGFAALTGDIQIYLLAVAGTLEGAVIKTSVPFSGPGITDVKMSLGIAGNLAKYLSPFDADAAIVTTPSGTGDQLQMEDFVSTTSVRLAAVSVGANLSALTAGAGCLWLKTAQLLP